MDLCVTRFGSRCCFFGRHQRITFRAGRNRFVFAIKPYIVLFLSLGFVLSVNPKSTAVKRSLSGVWIRLYETDPEKCWAPTLSTEARRGWGFWTPFWRCSGIEVPKKFPLTVLDRKLGFSRDSFFLKVATFPRKDWVFVEELKNWTLLGFGQNFCFVLLSMKSGNFPQSQKRILFWSFSKFSLENSHSQPSLLRGYQCQHLWLDLIWRGSTVSRAPHLRL